MHISKDTYKRVSIAVGIAVATVGCAAFIVHSACAIRDGFEDTTASDIVVMKDDVLDKYDELSKEQKAERAAKEKTTKEMPTNTPEADTGSGVGVPAGATEANSVYLIQYGDTLSHISAKVSRSVDELAEYNKIKDVNLIYAESALRIPQ